MSGKISKKRLEVYYDNECAVCSRFVNSVQQSQHVTCNPLQKSSAHGLSQTFHVITEDGTVYTNFDAVLQLGERDPFWKIFMPIARLPVFYTIFSFAYKFFAKHRYRISKIFTRFTLLKIILILTMISTFLFSPKFWVASRLYPLLPMLPFLPTLHFPFDYGLFFLLLSLLVLCLIKIHNRIYFCLFTIFMGFCILLDQSRLQPYIYQYFLMFLAIALYPWHKKNTNYQTIIVNTCCIIIACTYFYSGMQKINSTFVFSISPWMMEPVLRFIPKELSLLCNALGIISPIIEMFIGIGLVFKQFRNLAIFSALCMHGFILFSIGPLGHNWNSIVWPWNIAMCLFVIILFWRNRSFTIAPLVSSKAIPSLLILSIYGFLPLLSFFNLWDSYLSSTNYSGNTKTAQLAIKNTAFAYLDPELKQYISQKNNDYSIINIQDWSVNEMNVLDYPETRIFQAIAKSLCRQTHNPSDIILSVYEKPDWITARSVTNTYTCNNL
ncbi:MAG TPA: DCC1-like thiol-disulfide oxidoreductase family protein [Candidatus Saccharimonadales bacterium]|nr:DCC1-like thiol-disulfide oxidoreductase family protein [Candidatus Saccharimonadales bacterium]